METNEFNIFSNNNPNNINVENNNNVVNLGYFFDSNSLVNLNNNQINSFFRSHGTYPNNGIFPLFENINTQDNTNRELNNINNDHANEIKINDSNDNDTENEIIFSDSDDNINLNTIEFEKDTKESNKQNKFRTKKIGRPKKNQENNGQKHNRNSLDNARKKIYNSCKTSIYNFILKSIPSNLVIKLHVPTIGKQIGCSYKDNIKFFQKTIYDIFCDSTPKRVKNEIKNNRSEYKHNKVMIDMLIEQEDDDPTIKVKILKILFDLTFKDFLIVYLHDAVKLNIGRLTIDLKEFKTFGQCFNEYDNKYTQSQKNMFKKDIFDIIEGKKINKPPRAKIHNNQ